MLETVQMDTIRQILKRAGRRLSINTFFNRLQWTALFVAAVVLLLVLATKGFPVIHQVVSWAWFGPVFAAIALVAAWGWWNGARPQPLHVAIEVDHRLGMHEKFSTAMQCSGEKDAFAQAAVDDAIAAASDPSVAGKVQKHFPIRAPKQWWGAPLVILCALSAGFVIPSGDWFTPAEDQVSEEEKQAIAEINSEVDATFAEIAEVMGISEEELRASLDNPEADPNMNDDMGDRSEAEAKRDALKDLTALKDKLEEQTQNEQAMALAELQNKLSKLGEGDSTNDLAKALAAGDFSKAKQVLDALKKDLEAGNLNKDQKAKLAAQLQDLADQMEKLAQDNKAMEDALAQAGMDPSLAADPQKLQEALANADNLTEKQKEQLSKMAEAMAQAGATCKNMSAGMQQMANAMAGMSGSPGQLSEQLSQLEMSQMQMNAMKAALADAQGKCNKMGQGQGMCNNPGDGQGLSQSAAMQQWMQQMQQGNGRGGAFGKRGQGAGGRAPRLASQGSLTPDQVKVQMKNGPIIGERFIDSEGFIPGESNVELTRAIETQISRAIEDLQENRIPVRSQDAVKHYFGEVKKQRAKVSDAAVETSTESTTESSGDE